MPRSRFWLTVGAVLGGLALLGGDLAEAKNTRPRNRKRPPRGMLSVHGPVKSRTPGAGGNGSDSGFASPDVSRDVAGGALQGDGRKDVLQGGTAILLSSTRALVTNPYRGLVVVDVSDPDQPVILGSVALAGSADRVFLDGSNALVISQTYDAAGGRTKVTSVDLTDESSPAILGDVAVDGSLVNAVQSGGDLILVTSSWAWGPIYADGGGTVVAMGDSAGPRKGRSAQGAAMPDIWFPGGGGDSKTRVARIALDGSGAPAIVGTVEMSGTLLGQDIEGDTVALVVDDTIWWDGGPVQTALPMSGDFAATGIKLADIDASGAPQVTGRTLLGLSGIQAVDLAGKVARVVGWSFEGTTRLETFGFEGGDPTALGGADVPGWSYQTVFAGDRMAFTTTTGYGYGDDGMYAAGGVRKARPDTTVWTPPATLLQVFDLSDPANPSLGGSVEIGTGWGGSLQALADGGVVATVSDYDASSTRVVRVDLSDASSPGIAGDADVEGSWWGFQVLDDLLLLSGGTTTDNGGYVPAMLPVSLADGGLAAGGTIETTSWAAASAWEKPILALSSVDALALYDLSDFANPAARGSVRLAANVTDLALLDDNTAACLVTDYVGGSIEVRTVALPGADALAAIDTVTVGTGDARLFRNGSTLYVLASDWSTGGGRLTVVDAADPANLAVRGSLKLASYPGQAFLADGALVLLRESWSLVAQDEFTGRKKAKADPFGRARVSWTRDELSAVLDVIDLSNPDAPRAAVRKRIRWDFGGQAIQRGNRLYIPTYTSYGWSRHGYERVLYGVRQVDLSNPLKPRIGRVVSVPGSLVGATDANGRVLTVSYAYDADAYSLDSTLHLVDLRQGDPRRRVLASTRLDGTPGAVVVGEDHAYVATETWNQDDATQSFSLATFDVADLAVTSAVEREQSSWDGRIAGGSLFLRSWGWTGALDVYGLTDPAKPEFDTRADVDGVGTSIGVAGGRAYVPAGYRGIVGFDLSE